VNANATRRVRHENNLESPRSVNKFWRVNGVLLLISSIGVGVMTWVVLALLASAVQRNPGEFPSVPGIVKWSLDWRVLAPFFTMPAAACGLILVYRRCPGPRNGWLCLLLGSACLLAVVTLVIGCFVALIGPLYEYRPLG